MNWRVFGNSVLLPIISEGSLLWFVRRPSAYSRPESLDPILKHHDTRAAPIGSWLARLIDRRTKWPSEFQRGARPRNDAGLGLENSSVQKNAKH